MRVENVEVYGIKESIKSSGYPMMAEISDNYMYTDLNEKDSKRILKLGKAKSGSGHDCALKGMIVQYDLTCNHVMLPQFLRYHFHDIVSSQSKMHRIAKMDLSKACDEYVLPEIISIVNTMIDEYNGMSVGTIKSKQYEKIMSNLPMGLELTMRVTTNYLQLKSIWIQRKSHKMSFWTEYCDWIESLPMMSDILKEI